MSVVTFQRVETQWIGSFPLFVPVVEVIELEIVAGVEGTADASVEVSTGFDQETTIGVGARYEHSTWSPVWEKNAQCNPHDTLWEGRVGYQVRGYVRPCLTIKFYGLAGPYIDAEPYLGFEGNIGGEYLWYYQLTGGIGANLGFDLSILGEGAPNLSRELGAWEQVIYERHQEYPSGGNDPHDINGITFVTIPGGTFHMGDEVGDLWSGCSPVHTVTVSTFEMGVYEVTNAQYAAYLNAALASGDITARSSSVQGARGPYSNQAYIYLGVTYSQYPDARCWITYSHNTFSVVSGHENWPVAWVAWCGSKAFALYYGLDLPTEAEWEYACRGGRQYMYGTNDSTISSTKANYNYAIGHPVVVGSYAANPYGLYDMSGNVWEWCHDWYGIYPSGSVTNPSGALTGFYHVIRGGSWDNYAEACRAASRDYCLPEVRDDFLGFRVVRRPSPQNY